MNDANNTGIPIDAVTWQEIQSAKRDELATAEIMWGRFTHTVRHYLGQHAPCLNLSYDVIPSDFWQGASIGMEYQTVVIIPGFLRQIQIGWRWNIQADDWEPVRIFTQKGNQNHTGLGHLRNSPFRQVLLAVWRLEEQDPRHGLAVQRQKVIGRIEDYFRDKSAAEVWMENHRPYGRTETIAEMLDSRSVTDADLATAELALQYLYGTEDRRRE